MYVKDENVGSLSFFASISGLVVEYIVAIDVTRVRFPADALFCLSSGRYAAPSGALMLMVGIRGSSSNGRALA
jgi:hypothetical protein